MQLDGSGTLVALSLAQQTTPIAAGNTAIAVIFDTRNPGDAVIIAGY